MEARAYVEELIVHLVAELAGGRTTVQSVFDKVKGAAAALTAAGLLEPGDVDRFHERTLDALEGTGTVKRVSDSVGSSHEMTAVGPPGAGAAAPRRQGTPRLDAVVPIGQAANLADGRTLVLLSLNRWSTGFDLMYALVGPEPPEAASLRDRSPLDWDWSLTDDLGLRYGVHRAGGGGGGAIHWLYAHANPALRPDASSVFVYVARGGIELFSATIRLDGTIPR